MEPRPLSKFSENNGRRDALPEMTQLAEKLDLDVQHALEPRVKGARARRSPDFTSIRNSGEDYSKITSWWLRSHLYSCKHLKFDLSDSYLELPLKPSQGYMLVHVPAWACQIVLKLLLHVVLAMHQ